MPGVALLGFFGTKVRVTYLDADTDAVIVAEDVNVKFLPELFTYESVVRVKGHDCQVMRAMPRSKPEFTKEGTLLLQVRRVDQMEPKHRVFGFPSICTDMADPSQTPANRDTLRVKEDNWRQLELISQDLMITVNNELKQIRMVKQTSAVEMGYRKYYARRRPTIPVTSGVKLSVIATRFDALDRIHTVTVGHQPTVIQDGFSFEVDKGCSFYGLAPHGEVLMLAIWPIGPVRMRMPAAQKVKAMAEEFRLDLIDWAHCNHYPAGDAEFVRFLTS